jgi:hypothetical protein
MAHGKGHPRQPCRASRPTTCGALLKFKYWHRSELGFGHLADWHRRSRYGSKKPVGELQCVNQRRGPVQPFVYSQL